MKVLLTGGCGFVSRHIAQRCLSNNWHVTVVDNLSANGSVHPGSWAPGLLRPSAVCIEDVRSFFTKHFASTYDLIFHCAAVVGGRLKIEGDPLAVATDLAIDAEFFNWIAKSSALPRRDHKFKVVYFSSSAVYPISFQERSSYLPLYEGMVHFDLARLGMPDMTYGWAKLSGEYLAQQAVKKYGLDVVIYRPFSGYGHDQSMDYPFPSIVKRVLQGENPVTVWGSGDQTRDFIHIDDVVDAVFATMNKLKPSEALNLGSGEGISFRRLAIQAASALGRPNGSIVNDPSKPEGVFYRVADIGKLSPLYTPSRTLEWGILECAQWLEQTLDKERAVV